MDFVYICRDGENEELRYSIRSVLKYFNNASIWVVGGKPDWYSGNFINVPDIGHKFTNINNCYKNIIEEEKISNNFILMNDDFFLLTGKINQHYSGSLKDKIVKHMDIHGNSSYARALNGAVKALKDRGIDNPRNYDIHTPMTFNKAQLAQVLDLSLAPRSMYGNIFDIGGIEIQDVKVYKNTESIDIDADFISTEDNSFNLVKDYLDSMFFEPSKFEN